MCCNVADPLIHCPFNNSSSAIPQPQLHICLVSLNKFHIFQSHKRTMFWSRVSCLRMGLFACSGLLTFVLTVAVCSDEIMNDGKVLEPSSPDWVESTTEDGRIPPTTEPIPPNSLQPTTTTEIPVRKEVGHCPPGSWVMDVRNMPGNAYGLELDCYAPGAELKTATIRIGRNVRMGRNVHNSVCKNANEPYRGLGFHLSSGGAVVYGYCVYNQHKDHPYGGLCENTMQGVCGVEVTARGTTITQAGVRCCDVPNPGTNCLPDDAYVLVKEYNNISGNRSVDFIYDKLLGVSAATTESTANFREASFYSSFYNGIVSASGSNFSHAHAHLGIRYGFFSELSLNFRNLTKSEKTGYDWRTSSTDVWVAQRRISVVKEIVPAGLRIKVEQVVGSCGFLRVRTESVRTTYFDSEGRVWVTTTLPPKVKNEDSSEFPGQYPAAVIALVVTAGVLLVATMCLTTRYIRLRLRRKNHIIPMDIPLQMMQHGLSNQEYILNVPTTHTQQVQLAIPVDVPNIPEFEVPKEKWVVYLWRKLGSGHYGSVFEGIILKGELHTEVRVAVKNVHRNASVDEYKALLKELEALASIGRHERIANLIGAYTTNIRSGEIYVGVELCRTSLDRQLRRLNDPDGTGRTFTDGELTLTWLDLCRISGQTAEGLEYLADRHLVHRDVAARNVLLTSNNNVKICDFGLARPLVDYMYNNKTVCDLPWPWMSIESLRQQHFTTESDVWATGVTLWEIFTLGAAPFAGVKCTNEFIEQLANGKRLQKPQYASNAIYEMMMMCWSKRKEDRPKFGVIKNFFFDQLEQNHNQNPEYQNLA